ncbi:hypothetical protein PBF_00850 [Cytobacillus firmus DS1]|uniref:Uncharacterized protein n=1 Tax=Cytobacillus firmus DS1 TaxID=1307436 RepID=W7LCJ8_CYTFI|nr:hypothetical protein PBF_00850 [Cytobacillus firmus DS1]
MSGMQARICMKQGSSWRMRAVLAVAEGVFSGSISCNDTAIFFSDIERTVGPVLSQIYQPTC